MNIYEHVVNVKNAHICRSETSLLANGLRAFLTFTTRYIRCGYERNIWICFFRILRPHEPEEPDVLLITTAVSVSDRVFTVPVVAVERKFPLQQKECEDSGLSFFPAIVSATCTEYVKYSLVRLPFTRGYVYTL